MSATRLLKYLNYRLTAYTEHDVHSPFVYNFYQELIARAPAFEDFQELDQIRKQLQQDNTMITMTDLGAGSKKLKSNTRVISDIVRHGIARKKQAEFLYRLVRRFAPKTMIELGTSVGLTSLYLAKAHAASKLYTIEGCPELSAFSQQQFDRQKQNNIVSMTGNFDEAFPKLLSSLESVDLVYFDGNHAYEPTLRYFKMALEKKHAGTILIFDDIYWSAGMEKAWTEIHTHPDVRLSMDFFQFGIVFFRTEQKNKEHFVLKF
jgi:predicted O-methyltransferase YrrM